MPVSFSSVTRCALPAALRCPDARCLPPVAVTGTFSPWKSLFGWSSFLVQCNAISPARSQGKTKAIRRNEELNTAIYVFTLYAYSWIMEKHSHSIVERISSHLKARTFKEMEGKWGLILISIVVAIFAKYAAKLLNWAWFKPKKLENFLRNQGLNGNPYRPFFGDLKDFIRITKEEQAKSIQLSDDIPPHIYPYYHRIISTYGKNSFLWFGPYPRLNISDPELIKEIFKKHDVFEKGIVGSLKILAGGLSSLEGEKWTNRKKIINPAFHVDKLKNKVSDIGLICLDMIGKWENLILSSNNEIDVWPNLEDLTGDVISRTAFGRYDEDGRRIFQLQRDKVKLILELLPLFYIPGWRYLPMKKTREVKLISKEMESIIRGMIEKRKKANGMGDDLLGILLESNSRFIEEEGNVKAGMSIEDVIEECQLFYLAGAETTSSLLVWTMLLLGKHPEWQTRAREEVVRVLGDSDPTFEAINHLKTVNMILQEVLRLYPPSPTLVRRTKEMVKLGNMTIPQGVYLTLLLGLSNYDKKIWGDDANEFKPQRFSDGVSNATKIQTLFAPFASGPRSCIGQNFAMIEAKIAVAMILRRFSFELSPSYSHAPVARVTTTPQYGVPLILHILD